MAPHDMTSSVTRLLHTIPGALDQLGIGRSTLYELMASGEIQTVKIGSRTLIAHDELVRYATWTASRQAPRPNGHHTRAAPHK